MIIFTDASGQIMAMYTHDTTSTVWTDAGYTRVEVTDEVEVADIKRHGRDAIYAPGKVTHNPNPIQPQPKPDTPDQARFKELKGKLLNDTATDTEVRELLKLQFTPGAVIPETRIR